MNHFKVGNPTSELQNLRKQPKTVNKPWFQPKTMKKPSKITETIRGHWLNANKSHLLKLTVKPH